MIARHSLLFMLATACGEPAKLEMVPIYSDAAAPEAAPLTPPSHDIACTIAYDHEEMNHMLALDECLGSSRQTCWSACENTCTSCGEACAGDKACEAHCLKERDTCKADRCGDVHTRCRTNLVRNWLSNKCDAVCAPFRACSAECSQSPLGNCQSKCDAIATASCNPYRCDALESAPERKTLDPRWRANDCDRVCSRVWRCAETQCNKTSGCGEAVKMYGSCVARTAGAGACGLAQSQGLCPEH